MTGPAGRAPRPVPAIEVGGSHVTAAFVDLASGKVGSRVRRDLEPDADAETLLHTIAAAATTLGCAAEAVWSAAVPGPFDYATGVAHYRDAGKFESLTGVHVGMELMTRIKPHPSCVRFIGDAMAFTLGEYHFGSAHGHSRVVGITLGTGVGTGFVADGHLVTDGPDVPEQGRADLLLIGGKPLENTVSTRAISAAYTSRTGRRVTEIAEIVRHARSGNPAAAQVLHAAFRALGVALAPYLARFAATAVVVGGGVTAAWDVIAPSLQAGLATAEPPHPMIVRSADTEAAALLGAASI